MSFRHVPQTNSIAQNSSSLLSNDVSREEIDIKVVCVGAANTGKTTFLRYWETGRIPMHVSTTIQMEFHRREMTIEVPPRSYFHERDQNAHGTMPSSQTSRSSSSSSGNNNSNIISGNGHNGNGFSGPAKHFSSSQRVPSTLPNPFGADYAMSPMPLAPFHLSVRRHPLVSLPAIVKVWDIQGQESTKRMTRVFYTGAVAVLIFCELSSGLDSLTSALSWRSDALEKIRITRSLPGGGDAVEEVSAPCWLVVNKYDLLPALPAPPAWASRAALDELCARHGFAGWSYTAGRHGMNVEETLRAAIDAAVEALPEFVCPRAGAGDKGPAVVPRTRSKPSRRQQGGCCHR